MNCNPHVFRQVCATNLARCLRCEKVIYRPVGEVMRKKDVNLGNGVFISWTSFQEERVGGLLIHPKSSEPNADGECFGSFWFKQSSFNENAERPVWEFNNDFERPTLSPSFMCHCGFHGWIRDGKWEQV